MRALFVYRYLSLGGVETVLRARLAGLERRGIHATCWFLHDIGGRSVFDGAEDRFTLGPVEDCVRHVLDVDLVSTIDTPEILTALGQAAASTARATPGGSLAGPGERTHPPIVVECHTPYVENLDYLRSLVAERTPCILVPSAHQARIVAQRVARDIAVRVVPNPLNTQLACEPVPAAVTPAEPVVAWVGRLDELKNWRGFIDLAGEVFARAPRGEAWIVGAPVTREVDVELRERARARGLLPRLRWFRGVPHNRVGAFFDAVRDSGGVVVSTSRGDSFGMTVAEAMARACAVVVPAAPPFTEYVHDGISGRTYPPGDVSAGAACVLELLADPERRGELGRHGRTAILAITHPETAIDALADALRTAVAGAAAPT